MVWHAGQFAVDCLRKRLWTQPTQVSASQHADASCEKFARLLFSHLNYYRAQQGLSVLKWNSRLELSSLYHSTRMAETGEFEHTLADGVELSDRVGRYGYRYSICAENIAYYQADWMTIASLAKGVHVGWLNSPPHLENIENREVTEVGIGVVRAADGTYYATQNFGKPADALLSFG